jgi:hypothetical protein
LDDFMMVNQCELEVLRKFKFFRKLLRVQRFVINEEKSVETPSQAMEFLGLIVNTITLIFRLPSKKVDSMVKKCVQILSKRGVQLRVLASHLGDFTWASSAVPFTRSHYREVQSLCIGNSKFYKRELDTKVDLTHSARSDLLWWVTNLATCQGVRGGAYIANLLRRIFVGLGSGLRWCYDGHVLVGRRVPYQRA